MEYIDKTHIPNPTLKIKLKASGKTISIAERGFKQLDIHVPQRVLPYIAAGLMGDPVIRVSEVADLLDTSITSPAAAIIKVNKALARAIEASKSPAEQDLMNKVAEATDKVKEAQNQLYKAQQDLANTQFALEIHRAPF